MKLKHFESADGPQWLFFCPGCNHPHAYDGRWTFNGDSAAPTFAPSLLNTWTEEDLAKADAPPVQKRCHLFLTAGNLVFCHDSTHALAGKTVPLPELHGDWS